MQFIKLLNAQDINLLIKSNQRFLSLIALSAIIHAIGFTYLKFTKLGLTEQPDYQQLIHVVLKERPELNVQPSAQQVIAEIEKPLSMQTPNTVAINSSSDALLSEPIVNSVDDKLDLLNIPETEPKYYLVSELDDIPVILQEIDINPQELADYPEGGMVTVEIWLDEYGSVTQVELLHSDLPSAFSATVVKAFSSANFTPSFKNGVAVRARAKLVVNFSPKLVEEI
jgi:TonB family protein